MRSQHTASLIKIGPDLILVSEATGKLDKSGEAQLENLHQELQRVKTAKDEYVKEHPEHAKLVFPQGRPREARGETSASRQPAATRSLFGANGLP